MFLCDSLTDVPTNMYSQGITRAKDNLLGIPAAQVEPVEAEDAQEDGEDDGEQAGLVALRLGVVVGSGSTHLPPLSVIVGAVAVVAKHELAGTRCVVFSCRHFVPSAGFVRLEKTARKNLRVGGFFMPMTVTRILVLHLKCYFYYNNIFIFYLNVFG